MREIASERYRDLTSPKLQERRSRLIEARRELGSTERERARLDRRAARLERRLRRARGWLRWLTGFNAERLEAMSREVMFEQHRLEERVAQLKHEAVYPFEAEDFEWQRNLAPHFDRLSKVKRIWDVTHDQGQTTYKSSASESIRRRPVRLTQSRIPAVHPEMTSFCFGNANGPDLHIFPGLVVLADTRTLDHLALVAFSDCEFLAKDYLFLEEEGVPSDAEVVRHTWRYVNKDGSPDRRFSHNPRIPVCLYAQWTISSTTGLNETYMFSDLSALMKLMLAIEAQQTEKS